MKKSRFTARRPLAVLLGLCVAFGLAYGVAATVFADTDGAERDTALATTYKAETDLVSEPTVVCDVTNETILNDVLACVDDDGSPRPSNAIFRFDANCNVVGENGATLGSFYDIYKRLNHKIIPVAYVSDGAGADAFVEFMDNTLYILDIAVMSDDASLVKKVRDAEPAIRGIVEYTNAPSVLYDIVKESTEAQAMTVALSQKLATVETVNYLQARFKTVWVKADAEEHGDYVDCIAGGAFGVICRDFAYAYYSMGMLSGYTRNIFNVAHRALPNLYNENGLLGIEAAMRSGVTHLELDGHLTKDKRIVIIHDDKIDGMTNGSGVIEDMTYEEIQQYELDVREPHEKVPSFEQVIELMTRLNEELGTDVVLVFEIKDDQRDFVEYMKEILDRYDFYDHIVVITFDNAEKQLDILKETVPWIPTATLDLATLGGNMAALNGKNTGTNHIYTDAHFSANKDILRDRGYIGWYWTFGDVNGVNNASKNGVVGVTNNVADCFKDNFRYIYGNNVTDAAESDVPAVGDTVTLNAVMYSGEEMTVQGKVYYTDIKDGNWRCFASYTDYECGYARTVYTQGILYFPPVPEIEEPAPFPWWIPVVAVAGVLVAGGAVAVAVIAIKKKKA